MRVVIESPLAGDFRNNYRFALWCARAMWLQEGLHAIGSHMLNPWFMDDTDPEERQAGIDNAWVWETGATHTFFRDLGESRGMRLAQERCSHVGIAYETLLLSEYAPECWAAYERGEWPPHTPAFRLEDK